MEEDKPKYFYRLIRLVVDLGAEVLLKVFKSEINVSNKVSIEGFLKSKESKIKGLKKRKILNDKQLETLNQTNFDETKLDISLLYTLLRNLTDIQQPIIGMEECPLSSDMSTGALLTRLKYVQNEVITHRANGSLKKSEFEKFWKEASFCLVELAGGISSDERLAVQKKVDDSKTQPLLGGEIEKHKLDVLLKWDLDERCSELGSKVDTLTDKFKRDFGEIMSKLIEMLQAKQVHLPPEDPITNPNALDPDDMTKNSKEIGPLVRNDENVILKSLTHIKMEEDKPEYFYRLIRLVADLGTEVLLKIFKHENKVSIEGFLKSNGSKIKELKKRKILNVKQLETLNQTDFNETKADISLLYTLLRYLTDIQEPNNGWDACPLPSDMSPGALLIKLKDVRNEVIAHRAKGSLKKSEFEKFWKEASLCLVELAGGISSNEKLEVQKKVDHCKTQPRLREDEFKFKALLKWEFEERCSVLESKLDVLEKKISKQGRVTEDMMSSLTEIQDHMKKLSAVDGSTGTSSLVKPSPSTSAGSELEIQVGQLKQRSEQIQRQLISQKMYNTHQTLYNIGQQGDHQQAWPFIGLGTGYGHTTTYSDNPHSMCRGGVGDEMDGSNSSLYKKTKDETLSQSVISTLNECMKRVGCLIVPSFGGTRGTVFRAGDKYVITASHVLDRITDNMYGESLSWNDSTPAVYIDFTENQTSLNRTVCTVKPPCFINRKLDVAILEISHSNKFLPRRLLLSKTDELGSSVSCIGYGRPRSNDKHVDPNCCVLTVNSSRVQNCLNAYENAKDIIKFGLKLNGHNPERVKEPFKGYDAPHCFLLSSFFEHGGSGGPAIDHSISRSPVVVGIYTQGFPSTLFDLPDLLRHGYKKECRFEMCTKTSSLYTTLVSQDQELARNIFG